MGYSYELRNAIKYRVKYPVDYYWKPIRSTFTIFPDDILHKNKDGTYTKETGLCITGLNLKDEDVEQVVVNGTMIISGGG